MEKFVRKRVAVPAELAPKWSAEVLAEGFVPFPKRLLRCLPAIFVGPHAMQNLAVVLAVADYSRANLVVLPSIDYLAFLAGMTPDRFARAIARLAKEGVLSCDEHDGRVDIKLTGLLQRIVEETSDPE